MWCNWGQRNTQPSEGSEKSMAILRPPFDCIAAYSSLSFSTLLDFLDVLNSRSFVSSLFYFTFQVDLYITHVVGFCIFLVLFVQC